MPGKLKDKLKFFESLSSSSHQNPKNPRSSILPDDAFRQNNNNNESISPRNGGTSARNSVRLGNPSEDTKIPRRSRLVGEDIVYEEEPQNDVKNINTTDDSVNQPSTLRKKKDSLYRVVKLDKDTNEIKEREIDNSKQASRRNSISILNQNGNNKSNSLRTKTDSKTDLHSPTSPSKAVPILEDFATITDQLDQISDSHGEVPLQNNRKKPQQEDSLPQSKEGLAEVIVDATSNANLISAPKTPRRLPPISNTPRSPVPPLALPSFQKVPLPSPSLSERSWTLDSPVSPTKQRMPTNNQEIKSTVDSICRKQMEEEDSLEVTEGRKIFKQLESYMQAVAEKKSQLLQKDFQNGEVVSQLEKKLSDANIENQALAEQIEWLQLQIEEMNKTRDCQDSLITTLQQELQQTSRLNDELSLKMDSQEQTIRSLETQLKKYKSYANGVHEYEQIITKLNKNVATLTSELQRTQQENSSQATALQSIQTDNRHLTNQIIQIEESLLCVICTERVADCVASPCHHQAVCDACCRAKNLAQCVLCRAQVHKYLKVYVNWTPKSLK